MGKVLDTILKEMKINRLEDDPKQREDLKVYNEIRARYNPTEESKRPMNETEFYAAKIGMIYGMAEFNATMQKCKEKGHIEGTPLFWNGIKKSYLCKRCHLPYDRHATSEEYAAWDKMMHTPMTI